MKDFKQLLATIFSLSFLVFMAKQAKMEISKVASEGVKSEYPSASTAPPSVPTAPTKPVKKAVGSFFKVPLAKDVEPTHGFIDEVKGCTDG